MIQVNGLLWPLGQIPGSANNDSANAGNLGEIISSSVVQGSAVVMSNNADVNLTSITLTPGRWTVFVDGVFLLGSSTTVTNINISISTTTGAKDLTAGIFGQLSFPTGTVLGTSNTVVKAGPRTIAVAANTPIYGVGNALFGVSTVSLWGKLWAVRV
jgi:hypothetical protein